MYNIIICRKIAGAIRVKAGRKSVTPGLKEQLTKRNHSFDHLFINKTINVLERVKKSDGEEEENNLTEDGRFRCIEKTGVF